jgi:hypothetical protein
MGETLDQVAGLADAAEAAQAATRAAAFSLSAGLRLLLLLARCAGCCAAWRAK